MRLLRDDAKLEWAAIAKQLGLARSTAFDLYACRNERTGPIWGARRPVIATLALAGPRVTELCHLNVDDLDLAKPGSTSATRRPRQACQTSTFTRGFLTS